MADWDDYVELAINETMHRWAPTVNVCSGTNNYGVIAIKLSGKRLFVDDIVISSGKMRRSYQVIPGAAIGGVLGSQTGPNVTPDDGQPARYFHYNELGTVLAETKTDGTVLGAWEPDYFGNYEGRYLLDGSPDRPELGLTGKIWDEAAGAYYFGARWLNSERGRWLSEEPLGIDGPNLYHFGFGNIINGFDANGLTWYDTINRLLDWITGDLEDEYFDRNTNETKDLLGSPGVDFARKYFYRTRSQDLAHKRLPRSMPDYGSEFSVSEFVDATVCMNSTRHFVGSYDLSITPLDYYDNDPSNDELLFKLTNTTSLTSASYHVLPSHEGGPMGNVKQVYYWTEPLDWNRIDWQYLQDLRR